MAQRKTNPPEIRGWICKYDGNFPQISKIVRRRLQIIHDKLWLPGRSELFWEFIAPIILGQVHTKEKNFLRLIVQCLKNSPQPDHVSIFS
ncbi:MAG: hypothetical protein NTW04_05285, partial [Elusimicrobia bacterium]|nr:hypothetical protein [Elusimicrobiota bacterium]